MIELTDNDFIPLAQFSLTWRWTDLRWNHLPEGALNSIRPLREDIARRLSQRSLAACDASRLNPDLYISVAELDSSVSARTVREWMRERAPNLDQLVIVSWTAQAAIVTTWRVFTEYWDDFCYPASDNVMIWPVSEAWALRYDHEEQFYYRERACNNTEVGGV
jgi:hypothetical protein